MKSELITIIKTGNILGEGVQWQTETETLCWTDIQSCLFYSMHLPTARLSSYPTPERLCSFGFTGDKTTLIVAFESGFAWFHYPSQAVARIRRTDIMPAGTRFNDGKVDRQGRFWAGTMVEAGDPAVGRGGSLYSLDQELQTRKHVSGVGIANGLCWSPDASLMYFADSARRVIYRYEFDPVAGSPGKRSVFAETENGAEPDGAEVDNTGCLWSAHWGAGRVVRYTPNGAVDYILDLPVSQPTCVTFGGKDYDWLFITTAKQGLNESQLADEPYAGDVFVYRLGVAGLPAHYFRRFRPPMKLL